jgi:hypothetical protein
VKAAPSWTVAPSASSIPKVNVFSILLKEDFMESKLLYQKVTKGDKKFPFFSEAVEKLPLMVLELIFPRDCCSCSTLAVLFQEVCP